ncbi:MAG: DUF421 domain-containing protein [Clostridia bacterium]|nr:DUF421 domain-containing protein [Clostridia bacterium]
MLTTIFRVLIIYLVVLILYRIMGKRQLGQMQPFELVLTLIIADLATIPMAEISVPVLHGIIPLLTLTLIHFVLTLLSKFSNKFANFLSGKPVIVINPDGIDYRALKNLNLSVDDVFEAIRGCGFFSIEQIQYAIMETNGKMTVLPKGQFSPLTPATVGKQVEESVIPINIINEGKINKQNLQVAKLSEIDLKKIFEQAKIKKVKEILVLTVDKSGGVYLQKFGEKYQTLQISPLGQVEE